MASRKNVPASTVRAWAAENGVATGSRGRLHPDVTEAFHKANPRLRYEPKIAEAPTVTVKVPTTDKRGRNRTKAMTIPATEARSLAGDLAGKRGRLSEAAVERVAEALATRL